MAEDSKKTIKDNGAGVLEIVIIFQWRAWVFTEAIRKLIAGRRNLVVATGTGSGKQKHF